MHGGLVHVGVQVCLCDFISFSLTYASPLSLAPPLLPPFLSRTLFSNVHFWVSSAHLQLLAFFLNAYNLMVLHAHVVRGSLDGSDFKSQKIPFTRDNQYMIAAYNYSLGTH